MASIQQNKKFSFAWPYFQSDIKLKFRFAITKGHCIVEISNSISMVQLKTGSVILRATMGKEF